MGPAGGYANGDIVEGSERLTPADRESLCHRVEFDDGVVDLDLVRSDHKAGCDDAALGERGCRGDQPAGVRVVRLDENGCRRTLFDDVPVLHDDHPVGTVRGDRQIVGDDQQGGAGVAHE